MTELLRLFDPDPRPDPCEPETEIVRTADRLTRHRPSQTGSPWWSAVEWVRWNERDVDRGIAEVTRYFSTRAPRFTWSVRPDSTPGDLAERLLSRGFQLEAHTQMLVATLPITGLRTSAELVIKDVSDEPGLRDSIAVDHPDWDETRRAIVLAERLRQLSCPERQRFGAVAYLEGRPIAAARWRFDDRAPVIHLSGAQTLPEYRSHGAYSTLVAYRDRLATARGCRWATVFANESTSAPILMKRGFRSVGRASFYLSPESRSSSS